MECKIAKEVAEAEFEKWAEDMDLDHDTDGMDAEDLTAFNKQKNRIVRSIMQGALVFNDDGEAVFTPQHKNAKSTDPITFYESDGASLKAMDGKKKNQDMSKTFAVMAAMCKVPPVTLVNLIGPDRKVAMALYALLMD